ncbi:MAG: hypothetical protein QF609_09715, partial [Gammaproteobacteria bacterium]|nr:hypothetical protein [Gammaproteobacteria bacterium]
MGNFSFVHLADPQFGLFADSSGKTVEEIVSFAARGLMVRPVAKFEGLGPETELFTKAISATNARAPRFTVVCGDIVNSAGNRDQIRTAKRIADELD